MWTGCFTNRESAGREKIEVLPLPQQLKDEVPAVGDFVQNRWGALARDWWLISKARCTAII